MTKTGECKCRNEVGQLMLAESFVDENGVVTTTQTPIVEEASNGTTEQA